LLKKTGRDLPRAQAVPGILGVGVAVLPVASAGFPLRRADDYGLFVS
jgi:hypothetical protein